VAAVFENMHQSDQDIRNRLLIARLPAMPQILVRLIEHLQADDLGMPELAALISKDAGMTGKLLAVANSSAYHRNSRNVNLEQSLVALGTDMIKTLVISDSVFQTFNSFPHSGSTDLRAFWKNSLTAAVIAREAARAVEYPHLEEAYLAGLLHNVGRLALLATAPKEYGYNFTARDDEDLCAVEQRTLQITHAEAGAWLIERWQLDSFLADAVLYHHEPSDRLESSHPLIRIVRLAHVLSSHADNEAMVREASALCGMDGEAAAQLLAGAARQVEKAAAHLGIDLTGADDIPAPPAYAPPVVDPVQQRLSEEVRNMVLVSEVGQRNGLAGSDDAHGAHPVRFRERGGPAGEPDRPCIGWRADRRQPAHRRIRRAARERRPGGQERAGAPPGLHPARAPGHRPGRGTAAAHARHR
jgi:HD-like signal output (HDOD) protein